MVKIFVLALGLSGLAACAAPPASRPAIGVSWQASASSAQGFHFDWRLSGDPAVAPIQVFDDGRETWLQFAPGQPLPAIFGVGPDGERVLPYLRREPYVVLAGDWRALLFRGGRLSARARRGPDAFSANAPPAAPCRPGNSPVHCGPSSAAQDASKPL